MKLAANRRRASNDKRKREDKHADKGSEACSFWSRSHKRCNRCRRPFVNVGCPNVKWRCGNLESETNEHHCCPRKQQQRKLRIGKSSGYFGDVCCARQSRDGGRGSVSERNSVKQEC